MLSYKGGKCSFVLKSKRFQYTIVISAVWGIIFLIKVHSECRRQRVLNRSETNTRVCVDKRGYNRNLCISDPLGVQQRGWLL